MVNEYNMGTASSIHYADRPHLRHGRKRAAFLPWGIGMGLNIKSEEAHRLATEVAQLAGETLTDAVIVALRERFAPVSRRRQIQFCNQ